MKSKDANWFTKLQRGESNTDTQQSTSQSPMRKVGGVYKFEMSKEDHKKFNQEMV